ncbi:ADP-ribose pyrophosphatase [Metallosphaera sp. J1]|uniref:NUDIX hydrolase n=1 Tax=Metallosphaera javensis (ex Hofmann et al. 2022) TaxID=99938 RepID=UPI001EDCB670|nr:NUDIX domain-containing protein [Metallosphaera javensis (ex Hofmann et al. 2022)]MCG3107744.1 ADP-ribose pyrophosphatase [Metallosphaera javensis (ex Hofmann et al. 2022)]
MRKYYPQVLSVHLFWIVNDKILLQRRYNTGYMDGYWSVPAGHVDAKESATNAIIREAKEELGVDFKPEELKPVYFMHRFENQERVDFFFRTSKIGVEPKIMEPDKADALDWFLLSSLPQNMVQYVRRAIESYLNGEIYSEFGWYT